MSAPYRAQNYIIGILESQVVLGEHQVVVAVQERHYILDQFEEFVLYVTSRFGR